MSSAHKLEVNMKQNQNETRISLLEQSIININETLKDIKTGQYRLEDKINALDKKMDERFERLNSRIWSIFYYGLGAFASMLALVAHGFKWI